MIQLASVARLNGTPSCFQSSSCLFNGRPFWYGDYYYPCLTIENEEPPTLTKYGRMREKYLREHRKVLYCNLLTSGKLYEHLVEIDTSACNMAEHLIKEMARKQGVTEQLKAEDMMRWVGLMNNIRACADEIVLNDIVYS